MVLVNLKEHLFHAPLHEFPIHLGVLIPSDSFRECPIPSEVSGQLVGSQESKECLEVIG